jgi:hypothetical protein
MLQPETDQLGDYFRHWPALFGGDALGLLATCPR